MKILHPSLGCLLAAFSISAAFTAVANNNLFTGQRPSTLFAKDTASELPCFNTKEEYENYLLEASALPMGFATGSAKGQFIPEEAPMKGYLPIKATVIYLSAPTNNWAAVFTQNKVSYNDNF
jgi:hypothetical protein